MAHYDTIELSDRLRDVPTQGLQYTDHVTNYQLSYKHHGKFFSISCPYVVLNFCKVSDTMVLFLQKNLTLLVNSLKKLKNLHLVKRYLTEVGMKSTKNV